MRVAIITESYPPDVNGVANSVVRVAENLVRRGHAPLVIAPEPPSKTRGVVDSTQYPVIRVPSIPLPGYQGFRLGLPSRRLTAALREHGTDVVHLASPFVLGARGAAVARKVDLPSVAVYQTDMAAYARAYHVSIGETAAWRWIREIHNRADRTLAPSTAAASSLVEHGVERVWLWPRGVDSERFHPAKRSARLRKRIAPNGELIVGYVGRLALEKRVELLASVCRLPGVRVVIVGAGPVRKDLEKALPGAVFLGELRGEQLARVFASLDVFAHTGPHETFGQTIQEALACGLPVIAPAAGGPLDLVHHDQTGLLIPPNDAAALAQAVRVLAADRGLIERYGVAARESIAGRSWDAVTGSLLDHYAAVTTTGAAVGAPLMAA